MPDIDFADDDARPLGARCQAHGRRSCDDCACRECGEDEGRHDSGCRSNPDWEPSDDDLDLSGERAAASREAERRTLRDAGRGAW